MMVTQRESDTNPTSEPDGGGRASDEEQQHTPASSSPARRAASHFAERSLLGLAAVVAAGLGFGVLLVLVRLHWSPLQSLDRGVAADLNALVSRHPGLVTVLDAVSRLGGRPFLIWLIGLPVLVLLVRRRFRLAVYLTVTGVGALLLDPSLKTMVGRLRPVVESPVATAPGNSFPSGHSLGSVVAYGALLLVFLPALRPRWRRPVIAAVAVLVAAIGFTRLALGVHFVSDVLAGWLLGAAWLGVTAYAFRLWRRETGRPVRPLEEGLEPEAGHDISPAPDEKQVLAHPWAGVAELLTGWVLIFGVLYAMGVGVSRYAGGTFIDMLDTDVPQWLSDHRTPRLDSLSWLWSKAGDTHAITFVSLLFCAVALAAWRRWRPILFVVLALVGELTLFLASAQAVDRPRPEVTHLDGQMPTSSFPSGHIAATCCLYVAIAVLVMPRLRHWSRWLTVVLVVLMPSGVALSRMYRGMHHPSDVAGALVLTALWMTVLWWVIRPNADVTPKASSTEDPEAPSVGPSAAPEDTVAV